MPDPVLTDDEIEARFQAELASDPHMDRDEKAARKAEHAAAIEARHATRAALQAVYEAKKGR